MKFSPISNSNASEKRSWAKLTPRARRPKIKRLVKQLRIVDAFIGSDNRPEWMVLTALPVVAA